MIPLDPPGKTPEEGTPAMPVGAEPGAAPTPAPSPPPSAVPTPAESSGLAQELLGFWETGNYIGNCTDVASYLHFSSSGVGEQIEHNNDACDPEDRGTFVTPASYSLSGRTLSWRQPGSRQSFDVAVGALDGTRWLAHHVFTRSGELRWRSTHVTESYDAEGTLLSSADVLDFTFDAPLPTEGTSAGEVVLQYTLERYDRRNPEGTQTRVVDGSAHGLWRYGPMYGQQQLTIELPRGELSSSDVQLLSAALPISDLESAVNYSAALVQHPADPAILFPSAFRWFEHEAPPAP